MALRRARWSSSRRPKCATRSARCRACCTSSRSTTAAGRQRRDVDILAVLVRRRARLRQPGDGARRPPPGRPAILPGACGRGATLADDGRTRAPSAGARGLHRAALPRPAVPPPLLVKPTSMPIDEAPARRAGAAGRRRPDRACTSRASSAASGSTWPSQGRRHRAGAAAGRRGLAARAHARAGRGARPRLGDDDPDTLAHRVLRHQPHRRRGDAGLVRGLREPPDADRRVPALQHRRHRPAATTTPRCARC